MENNEQTPEQRISELELEVLLLKKQILGLQGQVLQYMAKEVDFEIAKLQK